MFLGPAFKRAESAESAESKHEMPSIDDDEDTWDYRGAMDCTLIEEEERNGEESSSGEQSEESASEESASEESASEEHDFESESESDFESDKSEFFLYPCKWIVSAGEPRP